MNWIRALFKFSLCSAPHILTCMLAVLALQKNLKIIPAQSITI